MSGGFDAFVIERAVPLFDDLYLDVLSTAIERARQRIWVSMFIVNVTRGQDVDLQVRDLLDALAAKHAMGLDVRIVVGVSESTQDIQLTNEVAVAYLQARHVPVRLYSGTKHSTHSKYVVIDHDVCIVGSHNWTHNAFTRSVEDSVFVKSREHAQALAHQFLATWMAS